MYWFAAAQTGYGNKQGERILRDSYGSSKSSSKKDF